MPIMNKMIAWKIFWLAVFSWKWNIYPYNVNFYDPEVYLRAEYSASRKPDFLEFLVSGLEIMSP